MNFYLHYLGDYDRDTKGLSLIEHGAYRVLLDHVYATEQMPPNDIGSLYRIAGAMTPAERKAVERVAERFFAVNGDGRRHNKRAEAEIVRAQEKSQKAKASAAASVKARFGTDSPLSAARAAADPEWSALVVACGSKCVRCAVTDRPLERDHIIPTYQGGLDTVENWQPLCQKCNASKEPETVDHRPNDWRTNFERTLNARRANQNQNPEETKASPAIAGEGRGAAAALPACPHEKLIGLYHEVLPTCPKVEEWTGERQALMRARWREQAVKKGEGRGYATVEAGLAFWRRYFDYVSKSPFLMGNADGRNGGAPFLATLEWLVRPKNFAKVVEGNYHR